MALGDCSPTATHPLSSPTGTSPPATLIVYDYRNQMVEYSDGLTGQVHRYQYDALGRRIAKIVDAEGASPQEVRFYYLGRQVLEEQTGSQTTWTTAATYVYGNYVDEVLTMRRGGQDYYYLADANHNVVAVTDSTGAVVERYGYGNFGQPALYDASWQTRTASAIGNPYLFTGRRWDPESGLYWYRTRYYDPRAGRFTSRDTIGIWGDVGNLGNPYAYVLNNPWSLVDPLGLGWWESLTYSVAEVGRTIYYLPQGYWDTCRSGQQASSITGYADALSARLNPFGRGTRLGPQYGHVSAYNTGRAVGNRAGTVMNSAMMVYGIGGAVGGARAVSTSGGLLQVTTGGAIVVNGQAALAAAQTTAYAGVAGVSAANLANGGDDIATYKSSRQIRREWEQENQQEWPKDPNDPTRNQDVSHIKPKAEGGTDELSNIEPKPHSEHLKQHMDNGDFGKWGGRRKGCKE